MGTLRPPYQQKYFFGPRLKLCIMYMYMYVLKLKGAKIPKIMLWVILSLSTENGPRAEKNIFVDNVVLEYP